MTTTLVFRRKTRAMALKRFFRNKKQKPAWILTGRAQLGPVEEKVGLGGGLGGGGGVYGGVR